MNGSPRSLALRGALLSIGATSTNNERVRVGPLEITIADDHVTLAVPDDSADLAAGIVRLARLFALPVVFPDGRLVDVLEPQAPAQSRRTRRRLSVARSARPSPVNALLERIPELARTGAAEARTTGAAAIASLRERGQLVEIVFVAPLLEAHRPALSLLLARLVSCADRIPCWLCAIHALPVPPWLDRTLRNLDLTPIARPTEYVRSPRGLQYGAQSIRHCAATSTTRRS